MAAIAEMPTRFQKISSDQAERYEIVDGIKVELPPMSANSTGVASCLLTPLNMHGLTKNLGRAYVDMLFRLPLPVDRNRRPDVAFVPFSSWPKDRPWPSSNAWEVLPVLVVEVVSPFDCVEEARAKIAEYFRAGVKLVWQIMPELQLVDVFESPTKITVLTRNDELDGAEVLPGFRLPLRELFIGEPTLDAIQ